MTDSEFQADLEDIFQEIWFEAGKTNEQEVIEENIIEILKREKLWKKPYFVVFPSGAITEIHEESETYQYDYEIFSDLNTVIASGTCYGNGRVTLDGRKRQTFEVVDMTLEVCEGYKKLSEKNEREKVIFT